MRKFFILCLMAFVMCSCGIIQTYTEKCYGSVTTFTPQGEVLQTWDNVLIEETTTEYNTMYGTTSVSKTSAFKNFGLNFIDMNTGKGVIVHTSIPYIIEYNTEQETISSTPIEEIKEDIKEEEVSSLETKYHNLQNQISVNKKEMRKLSKKSAEYQIKKEQNEALRGQMNEIEKKYLELTGMYMYNYY